MGKIATKTIQYSVYDRTSGKSVYVEDTASYKRPSLEMLSDEISGAGIMGEIDLPSLGALSAMECELVLNKTNEKAIELFSPKVHTLEVRWATNVLNSATGASSIQANKEILKVLPKTLELGDIETNETNEATLGCEVLTYEYIIDGKSKIKIDKLNNVFKINGKDYSAELKKAL